jgi:hypothetical protein
MDRLHGRSAWLALGLALLCWVQPGEAAAAAALTFDWEAPGCASLAEFRVLMRRALPDEPEVLLERPLHVSVRILPERDDGSFALEIATRSGSELLSRELVAASCTEASEAAALIVAMAIDPPADEPPAEVAREGAQPWGASRALYLRTSGGVSLREVPRPSPLASAGLGLALGALELSAEGSWVAEQRGRLAGAREDGTARGAGDIGLAGGLLGLCYVPLRARVALLSCGMLELAAYRSRGVDISNPATQRLLRWAGALRLAARIRVQRLWSVFSALDLVYSPRSIAFVIDDVGVVYRAQRLGGRLSLGLELALEDP